nr:helix-turn-helix domain-containing protein [Micromonospora purpureochromogenes]
MTIRNSNGTPRLAAGQLTALVLEHMRTYPHLDFSPYEVAKVLGRSHGTIRRTLLRLTDAGTVTRTQQRPARFRTT